MQEEIQSQGKGPRTDTIKSILHYIVIDNGDFINFSEHCNQNLPLFGPKDSAYRKKSKNAFDRYRKKAHYDTPSFKKLLDTYRIDCSDLRLQTLAKTPSSPAASIDTSLNRSTPSSLNRSRTTPSSVARATPTAFITSRSPVFSPSSSIRTMYRSTASDEDDEGSSFGTRIGEFYFCFDKRGNGCRYRITPASDFFVSNYVVCCLSTIKARDIIDYELDFENPTANGGGVIPTYDPALNISDEERCGKVTLMIPVADFRDKNKVTAKLSSDRKSILVTVPVIPTVALENHDDIIEYRIKKGNASEADKDALSILMTKVKQNGYRHLCQTRRYTPKSSANMKFSNSKFNDSVPDNSSELATFFTGHPYHPDGDKKKLTSWVWFVFIQVLVEGTTQHKKVMPSAADNDDDFFNDMAEKMRGMSVDED